MGDNVSNLTIQPEEILSALAKAEFAEREMLQLPQVDCPVVHHFGPNICIREVFMPAGTFAIGHKQKFEHLNIMLRGKVLVANDDGTTVTLSAPLIFVGKPGRKIGYILEDMVWQNVYSTELKNIDEVEAHFMEKSDDWQQNYDDKFKLAQITNAANKEDYFKLLAECGISHETARQQTEDETDQIWLDCGNIRISNSPIDGKGVFVTAPIKANEIICAARINGLRTQAGRYTNHSLTPNSIMVQHNNGDIDLVALTDFLGCTGGDLGTEATINYRDALRLSGVTFNNQESICQA